MLGTMCKTKHAFVKLETCALGKHNEAIKCSFSVNVSGSVMLLSFYRSLEWPYELITLIYFDYTGSITVIITHRDLKNYSIDWGSIAFL